MHEEKNGCDGTKRTKGKHQNLYLNSPADTSKQCWMLELQLSLCCPCSLTRAVEMHICLCTVYICVASTRGGHMWRGDTLNVPQFVFPHTRNTVGRCANAWTAAETLPAQLNRVHHFSHIAWSVSLFMSHHTFECLSVRRNFGAQIDHSARQFSGLLQQWTPFSI